MALELSKFGEVFVWNIENKEADNHATDNAYPVSAAKICFVQPVQRIPHPAPDEHHSQHNTEAGEEIPNTTVMLACHAYSISRTENGPRRDRGLLCEDVVADVAADFVVARVAWLFLVGAAANALRVQTGTVASFALHAHTGPDVDE